MHAELKVDVPTIFGFLMVLARVSGVVLFVPIPGMNAVPDAARIVLCVALCLVLFPVWPVPLIEGAWLGKLPGWIAAEFAFGLLIGVSVAFLLEGVQVAAQMIGLQAGYSFASTIDPNTQADAGILQIVANLLAGVLFFSLGFDREVVRVLAYSLEKSPAIASLATTSVTDTVIRLGSQIFIVGLRLAMPVLALMIMLDISFAIVGKVHAQFQLLSVSFPAKMLVGLSLLATALVMFPTIYQLAANRTLEALMRLLTP